MADARGSPLSSEDIDELHCGIRNLSTAYNGAAGHITDAFAPAQEIDKEHPNNHRPPSSTKSVSPQREGFGSRLLSTLSNAQPAAAALRRSGSVLHSRTKSWAAYVPKLNATPISITEKTSYSPPNRIFGDLFSGESAPVRLGVPSSSTQEETEFVMEYRSGFTERPLKRPQRIDSSLTTSQPASKSSSWFGRKSITPITPLPGAPQDEFLAMSINTSLFPEGPVDPLSPHAFNDLLLNATSLLQRMQAAYREKVEYINSIRPEMDAQKEEAEEADTRAQHLKLQLEEMSRRTQDQDRVNRELAMELSEARLKLQELEPKTVRLVHQPTPEDRSRGNNADDGATHRRTKRTSAASASDSGFESDADTSSLFSAMTPDTSQLRMTLTKPPDYEGSTWGGRSSIANGMVLAAGRRDVNNKPVVGESNVWSTVEILRKENLELQQQLEQMDQSVQGCIDLIGGITGK